MEKPLADQGAAPVWWPPLRARLAERLRRHQENQRIASGKRLPRECREWFKQAKADGMIPGKKRTGGVTPWSFYDAYRRLLSLGGTLDEGDDDVDSCGLWFGSRDGILTKRETKRLAELEKKPRGWLRRDPSGREPGLLAITRSEHEQLKIDRPKLLKGVEVMEISEDEKDERLRLGRKLQEARMTEICFSPDFDTGKMWAMLCGPVPDDFLRKECSRSGRNLWHESPVGPPASGKPAAEVIVTLRARDVAARPGELSERDKAGITFTDFAKLEPKRLVLASNVTARIEQNQSEIQDAAGGAAGKIYRCASPEAVRVLEASWKLANRLQRPPTQKELREAVKWRARTTEDKRIKEFTALLREIGLAWLQEDHAARRRRAKQMRMA